MLGKRKRETAILRRDRIPSDEVPVAQPANDNVDEIFRKYFEARFDPLPSSTLATLPYEEEEDDSGDDDGDQQDYLNDDEVERSVESDWSGLSEEASNVPVVEVIDHAGIVSSANESIDKIFQKSFMGPKPPRETRPASHTKDTPRLDAEEEVNEKVNLKHDLELQRLLQESHLLEQTRKNSSGGAQRHKAMDMRLQALGSKTSLFEQEKMPMSHRKGILAKVSSKDVHRRKEARENGIILEKSLKKSSTSGSRRDRGVDVPVVGKFKGGTLQLSRQDVASIQGPRRGGSKRGRGRR